jgi:hypothetical protein
MSTEALFAEVIRHLSLWPAKHVEHSTVERRIDFKSALGTQRRLKSELSEEELGRRPSAINRPVASLNQESAEGRPHAAVRANSVAFFAL